MIDTIRLRIFLVALAGWVNRHQLEVIEYLREENRFLTVRMARENPTWDYRRIQGALQNLRHEVARSTVAAILRAHGIGPVPERPMSWGTFLAEHWGAIAAADFFTTEVWTVRGLVTYYTLFVIELESRRVHLVGSTPHPDDAFVLQVARGLTGADDGVLGGYRILICDRDTKWSATFRRTLADVGIRVVQTPFQAHEFLHGNARVSREQTLRKVPKGLRGLVIEPSNMIARVTSDSSWSSCVLWEL